MKKILLITDQPPGSHESAIEGLFKKYLKPYFDIDIVYFDKAGRTGALSENEWAMPWKSKRYGLAKSLRGVLNLPTYDFIVVRNFFPVLRQTLALRLPGKVGFWETFPHTWRRYEEACLTGKGRWRKYLEYCLKNGQENRLLARCDFYWPITDKHKELFRPDLNIPALAVPMGVDPESLPVLPSAEQKTGPLRFVYIGTIDALRRNDLMHKSFLAAKGDFLLDYYSNSRNEIVDMIEHDPDQRVRFHQALPREELFLRLAEADFGVCFLPAIKTYMASSPTKAIEYAAVGVAFFGNEVGQYPEVLQGKLSFVPFSPKGISSAVERLVSAGRGEICCSRVVISYADMAHRLNSFVSDLK